MSSPVIKKIKTNLTEDMATGTKQHSDFPGGPVVRNQPANAGNMGSIALSRKIPHALG